ncbi:hypothetical protein [Jeotgalibacillus proteolyticus]|uniref:hypothetical protein n=1 Tax=Jeotgalibacillus proteolyticus TaxID=2082395 RepID=UPI003CF249F4
MVASSNKKQGIFGHASKKSKIVLGILMLFTITTMNAIRIFVPAVSEFREENLFLYGLVHFASYGVTYAIWRLFFYRL